MGGVGSDRVGVGGRLDVRRLTTCSRETFLPQIDTLD